MHKTIAAKDLHAFVYNQRQRFAAVNFGDARLDSVFLQPLEDFIGIIARALLSVSHIGGGTEALALGGIGFSGNTRQLLLNHAELIEALTKGFTFGGIGGRQPQRHACAADGACAQLQASNVEDIESNFIAFM